jgi:hypothetical protein
MSEFSLQPASVIKERSMDLADHETKQIATAEQIRSAIESLTDDDYARLRRAGSAFLYGSEYTDPLELMNEGIARAMQGAGQVKGRHWPLHVPFVAFLIMTMSSVANASTEAPTQTLTDSLSDFVPEGVAYSDFAIKTLHATSVEAQLVNEEERAAESARCATVFADIEAFFADDEEVLMLVLCLRDGQRPREIQESADMTITQYNTARRRLRRGLTKLGLGGKRP